MIPNNYYKKKYPQVKIVVQEKLRIIRNISYHTESDFHAKYKGFSIEISEQDTGGYYARVFSPKPFGTIVDGYFNDYDLSLKDKPATFENVLITCLESIFY